MKVGAFPSVKRPSVIWVGIDDADGVATSFVSVARRQIRETTPIAIDDRRFVPHITVAYVRKRLDREGRGVLRRVLVEETPSLQSARTGPYRVERAVLYESVPTPNGTRYDERFQVAL